MKCSQKILIAAALATIFASASTAKAAVYITEFMSNTGSGQPLAEFVEVTNFGPTPVDMTDWSESDSSRQAKQTNHVLTGFGTLAVGESAIFTEAAPDDFRTFWWGSVAAAPAGLKIVGPYTNDNLSSSGDEVNLFDASFNPINDPQPTYTDRLTYSLLNGGTGNVISRNPTFAALGLNDNTKWVNSAVGDAYGSFAAVGNVAGATIGNPGKFIVPEPSSMILGLIASLAMALVARHRKTA
jgi:hypothetical protein